VKWKREEGNGRGRGGFQATWTWVDWSGGDEHVGVVEGGADFVEGELGAVEVFVEAFLEDVVRWRSS